MTPEQINQLANDSIAVIDQIKSGELEDRGGDLQKNIDYLKFLLDNDEMSSKLSDKMKVQKAVESVK